MAIWDASTGWVAMVVRARSEEETRDLAIDKVRATGLFEHAVEVPAKSAEWPLCPRPRRPMGILIEDIDQRLESR